MDIMNNQFGEFNDKLDIRQKTQLLTHVTSFLDAIHLDFIGKISLCYFRTIHKSPRLQVFPGY